MAIFRPNLTAPIPNNPFYAPESTSLSSSVGPLIVGSGITVNYLTGVITASGGGGSGSVTSVSGVAPVSVLNPTTTPQISVSNASTSAAGVVQLYDGTNSTSTSTALTANAGYLLQQQIDNLNISGNLTFAGTVDASTGNMLTVTTEGAAEGFAVGSPFPAPAASNADYYVVVTVAGTMTPPGGAAQACDRGDWWLSNGTAWQFIDAGPTIPVGTTTTVGIVQLCDSTTSTSNTVAATPNSVKTAFDLAAAAMPITGGTFTGPVTFTGTDTFNGCAIYNNDVTYNSAQYLCGPSNFCCPATFAECAIFNCDTTFNAPSTFCCPVSFCCTPILSPGVPLGCAADVTYDNAVSGLTATNVQDAIDEVESALGTFIPCAAITGKGAVLTGTGAAAVTALPVGSDGQVLVANSLCTEGLEWVSGSAGTVTTVSGVSPINVATGSSTPVVSIDAASTTGPGAVQLADNTTTNDPTMALSAAQGYALQQQVNSLLAGGGLTLAGTLDAATGLILTVTASGSGAGFVVGSALPTPVAGNTDYFVIVTVGGVYSPPGGGGPFSASQGDWFLSDGSVYNFLNVGPEVAYATTTAAGTTCFATNAQTCTGTATNLSVTPAGAAAAYIAKSALTAKGSLITASAASTPSILPVGSNGQVLIADSACAGGLKWGTSAGTPQACPSTLGIVYACTAVGGVTAVGYNAGQVATSGQATAMGLQALCSAINPSGATAIGVSALSKLTNGAQNTAVGQNALTNIVSTNQSTAVGFSALCSTTGGANTAIGAYAGCAVTSGVCNVLIGPFSATTNPTDSCQLRIGWSNANYWICGDNTKAIQPGAGIRDCAGSTGSANQVLLSNGANAICWGPVPGMPSAATPLVSGLLLGCTTTTAIDNVALGYQSCGPSATRGTYIGYQAGCADGGDCNTYMGYQAACGGQVGVHNVGVGFQAMGQLTIGSGNTALGCGALFGTNAGGFVSNNTGIGCEALSGVCGVNNVALGAGAGSALTGNSNCNVIIGTGVQPPLTTGSCQLAIGFANGCNWLTGCSNKSIRPGAGIVDCAGSCGTAGQVLQSTGANAIEWATPAASGGLTTISTSKAVTSGTPINVFTVVGSGSTDFAAWVLLYVKPGADRVNITQFQNFWSNNLQPTTGVEVFSYAAPTGGGSWAIVNSGGYGAGDIVWQYTPGVTGTIPFEMRYSKFEGGDVSVVP